MIRNGWERGSGEGGSARRGTSSRRLLLVGTGAGSEGESVHTNGERVRDDGARRVGAGGKVAVRRSATHANGGWRSVTPVRLCVW